MKRLYILRHGKSDWSADFESDHERPLADRGRKAAALIGRLVSSLNQVPELVVTSTAVRARDTAALAAAAGSWACPIEQEPALYGASPESVLTVLNSRGAVHASVMLVGHQPTWSELIGRLTGGSALHFPTAALARIDLAIETWDEIRWGSGSLTWLVTPKLLLKAGLRPES